MYECTGQESLRLRGKSLKIFQQYIRGNNRQKILIKDINSSVYISAKLAAINNVNILLLLLNQIITWLIFCQTS